MESRVTSLLVAEPEPGKWVGMAVIWDDGERRTIKVNYQGGEYMDATVAVIAGVKEWMALNG